jgi:dienelactone hydrolase
MLAVAAAAAQTGQGIVTEAGADGPAQTAYAPAAGSGRIVVVISGQTGPTAYRAYAAELARLGYYTVLLDGKDILNPALTGAGNLKQALARAQRAPGAVAGPAAVVGFSLGGGGALYNASPMADQVSMIVAYYPYTRTWTANIGTLVRRFKVPVLVLAAQKDRYNECCVVESMLAMETAARQAGLPFELVVYPEADHGFNLETGARGEPGRAFRRDDAADAWRRTVEMLQRHQPLN